MTNVIAIVILGVLIGAAVGYVHRMKKRGAKCIGCPHAKECSGKCN